MYEHTHDPTHVTVGLGALESWVRCFARLIGEHREHLTALDAAVGDGDHGLNMDRGMRAVVAALEQSSPPGPAALLTQVGRTLVSSVGGASGPLFGTLFLRMGASLAEIGRVTPRALAVALRAGLDGVVARGGARTGDKTLYDALAPAVDALDEALTHHDGWSTALRRAAAAAAAGRDATGPMVARKGRASYLGERSAGHVDPGAASVALLLDAAAAALQPPGAGPASTPDVPS